MLAAVLLGGGPAALFGVLAIAVGWLRSREPADVFRNNLATYAWFPLIAGLFFHATTRLAQVGSHDLGFYLLVFVAFILALVVNFIAIAGYQSYVDESSVADKAREALVPLLASELFSVLLTMAAVYLTVQLGFTGLLLFGLVLFIFQYLVGELL
jgi:hypothetical protein